MNKNELLIFGRGQHAIRASLLKYQEQPYFRRLSAIKAPDRSDRTKGESPAAPPDQPARAQRAREITPTEQRPPAPTPSEPTIPTTAKPEPGEQLSFLRFAVETPNHSDDAKKARDAKERLL